MEILKISYTIWRKHGDIWYCRVRQPGTKCFDVNLHTNDKSQAEAFIRLRKAELELYNSYVRMGEEVPEDVERKLLRKNSPVIAQNGPSKALKTLRACLDGFEAEMRRRGSREATIATYAKEIRLTVDLDSTTADFTAANVRNWLSRHDDCKSATRKSYSVALREFAKYLVNRENVDPKVLIDWPMTKVMQEERGFWTLTQMFHVIEAIQCKDADCEQQMKAYCWIMATCGSRQGETGELRWSDYRDGTLTFRSETTKNNKTRRVPLDMRVCEMIDKLPRKSAKIFPDIPDSQAGRYAYVAKAVRRSGMPHGGLHSFRHGACMHLYAKCNDIKAVAQLVGHSEAVSLKFYQAAREADELRGVVNKAYSDENMIPNAMDDLIKAGLM